MSTSKLNSDKRKTFTANFRMLLVAADWTQTEAAQQLGISQGSVSDFTSGKRVPSTKGIESIAYRLGVPAEVFTSKTILLDQMRKLLSGNRPSRIAESNATYRISQPDVPWLRKLKQRWKRKSAKRDDIRVAVRVLFREQADEAIKWLDGP
jgi:transcriptional regulator with XRE-family HTH domain